MVNSLNSIQDQVNHVLGIPPDDQLPSPNIIGVVNHLGAMENKLLLLDDMVRTIGEEVGM